MPTESQIETLHKNNAEANAFTKECIETALVQLMDEKEFSKITITDITKRAGVSRLAYYRNYESKEAILSTYLQNVTTDFYITLKDYDSTTQTREMWVALLTVMQKHAKEMDLLFRAGYSAAILDAYVQGINAGVSPEENPALYYSNSYWVGAIHSMTQEWLKNGMDVPIDTMADIGTSMMLNGIRTVDDYGNRCN